MNCIPVFIARENYWNERFKKAGLPIVGDDIKSQVGATIVHRTLARLFHDRGVKMLRTSQLNVGGNMDFYNMLERERLESKKISKTNAVTSIMGHKLPDDDVYIGPSDYVPWLTDRKWAHIRVEGQAFGDVPLNVEMKLEVWDSPNSAGIVIDAVRCCKLALNNGVGGQLDGPSSYLMKSPMNQRPDHLAREATETFIEQHARTQGAPSARRRRPRRSPRRAAPCSPLAASAHGLRDSAARARAPSHRAGHPVRVGGPARGQRPRRPRRPASCASAATRSSIVAPVARPATASAVACPRCGSATATSFDGEVVAVGEVLRRAADATPAPRARPAGRRRADGRGAAHRATRSTSSTCTSRSRRRSPAPRCATRAR